MLGQPSAAKQSATAIRYLGVGLNIRTARLTAPSTCGGRCTEPCYCEYRNMCGADTDTLCYPQGFRVRLIDGLERPKIPLPRRRLRGLTSAKAARTSDFRQSEAPMRGYSEMGFGQVKG